MVAAKNSGRRWQKMDKNKLDLEILKDDFQLHNRTEGKSEKTVLWYNEVLDLFIRWLKDTEEPTNIGSVDEHLVRLFVLYLQSRQCHGHKPSTHTINNRVRALRAFFHWLYERGYTKADLLARLRPPRTSELLIELLEDQEIAGLFANLDQDTAPGARDAAILALMLDAGLRLSEIVDLLEGNVHIQEAYLKVVGKGNKERLVPMGDLSRRLLARYYSYFRPQPVQRSIEQFFLSLDGFPLTGKAIQSMINRLARKSGIPRLHPHLCRHTYATNFLIGGGNVLLLKQYLGHTSLKMVDHYVHLASKRAAIMARNFSPLDSVNVRGLRTQDGRRAALGKMGKGRKLSLIRGRGQDGSLGAMDRAERARFGQGAKRPFGAASAKRTR